MSRARSSGPLDRFSAPVRAWFETSFAAPTAAQAEGWPAIADGDAHADPRADGFGQDARRVPVGHRPARGDPGAGEGKALPRAVRLAVARACRRRREEPAGAARRDRARGRAARRATRVRRRSACGSGDTPGKERQALVRTPPDILITTPESLYLMLTSRARETLAVGRVRHHRRDPRDGAHQARRALDAEPRTPRSAHREATAAHRPVGDAAAARRDRPLPRWVRRKRCAPGDDRRRRLAKGPRPRGRSSPSTTWPSYRQTRRRCRSTVRSRVRSI